MVEEKIPKISHFRKDFEKKLRKNIINMWRIAEWTQGGAQNRLFLDSGDLRNSCEMV